MDSSQEKRAAASSVAVNSEGDKLSYEELAALYDDSMRNLAEGEIVAGRVIHVTGSDVIVDIGFKSEGLISIDEFRDRDGKVAVNIGDTVEVLLEQTEDQDGHIMLSKQKAERMRIWNTVEEAYRDGKVITGRVVERIKGGLTVDVGLRAFLPGSLVDIKPVKNLESFRGEDLEFKVISLDRRRNNIVLSRKAVLEKEYEKKKGETLKKLKEGVVLKGDGQEHHRLRRVHRPGRHRRPAPHHRHLLGPRQPPFRALLGGRRGRGGGPQVRPRDRARLARLQAAPGGSLDAGRQEVPAGRARARQGGLDRRLRRLRRARGGRRGPHPRQRDVVDQEGGQSRPRCSPSARTSRRSSPSSTWATGASRSRCARPRRTRGRTCRTPIRSAR